MSQGVMLSSHAADRRAVLGLGALAVLARRAAAASPIDAPADADPSGLLSKLVDRLTFGWTPEEHQRAVTLGYEGYLEYHLNPSAIDDSVLDGSLQAYAVLSRTFAEQRAVPVSDVRNEFVEARLLRALSSKRQLLERVVEMWTNHFSIYLLENENTAYLKPADDRDVIRAHALGSFPNLLLASMRSPAMMQYLDNTVSTGNNPNENYSRELMELHTLGVSGGYSQDDVYNLALILTGWGYDTRAQLPTYGQFRYNNNNHSTAPKTFLGVNYPGNQGEQEGFQAHAQLANHPSTARFIAGKICREFLGENVSAATIDAVAHVYTATNGDIKQMLRETLRPSRLAAAQRKLKRPMHFTISAFRLLSATMSVSGTLRGLLQTMGNLPFFWPAPNGYPDSTGYWSGNLLPRWNFGAQLANNFYSGFTFDVNAFFAGVPNTADGILAHINSRIFGGRMAPSDLEEIRQFLLPDPPGTTKRNQALGLAFGSPSFQWF
jgi:uncharacterized protein (DUF1800 family)